jgi:hypothetical protein
MPCRECLLADEKNVDGAQIEIVVEWEPRKATVRRMHARIELDRQRAQKYRSSYHDSLSLVLEDMARPTNLIATAQSEKQQLVARVDWLVRLGRLRGGLALRRHFRCFRYFPRPRQPDEQKTW